MTDRELMQMALDVMLAAIKAGDWKVDGACDPDWVLNAIRARLAQPEQAPTNNGRYLTGYKAQPEPEPVAVDSDKVICPSCCHQFRAIPVNVQQLMIDAGFRPPFITPPQREFVGLTAKDLAEIPPSCFEGAIWADAKLKEKNA